MNFRNLALRRVLMEAATSDAGAAAVSGGGATPWHHADHATLVQSKGWKGPDDAIRSYAELEKFRGAPADRLLMLPERPDAPEWADVRKRVGWAAPDKPEDYGVTVPDGYPKEYANRISSAAHKLGVPKDTLLAIAKENEAIGKELVAQQTQLVTDRLSKADTEMQTKYGAKYGEIKELMTREYQRLGIPPEMVEVLESNAAIAHEKGALMLRNLVADLADARREAALHHGNSSGGMDANQARAQLDTKSNDLEWSKKATQRGTPESIERLRLIALAAGKTVSEEELKRQSSAIAG